jgi:hypothetical protein
VATTTIQPNLPRGAARATLAPITAGFAAVTRLFRDVANAGRCAAEAERLMALSDADLARRGLRRDEIVSYAFRTHMDA